jgi:predicted DNA-binding protein
MAKKKTGGRKVPATASEDVVRHARIELPDEDYTRLKSMASRVRISVAAYIRQAVMERIESDERRFGARD